MQLAIVSGSDKVIKLYDSVSDKEYVVVKCLSDYASVMDASTFEKYKKSTFYKNSYGYATVSGKLIHQLLVQYPEPNETDLTADHINRQRNDNRLTNLRLATKSEQCVNSKTLNKIGPAPELVELGVDLLPVNIYWDNIEKKFILKYENGEDPMASSTKSTKVSVVNQFRDILQKYISILEMEPIDPFCARRMKVATEYNQLIKAAHEENNTFPDGPYVNLDRMISELDYCRVCLNKLPLPGPTDVLHGIKNIPSHIEMFPEIDAVAIVKTMDNGVQYRIIFDQVFYDKVIALPPIDLGDSSACYHSTHELQRQFPSIITDAQVKTKYKYQLKDLIWQTWFANELLPNCALYPLNYQSTDMRRMNMRMAPGVGKNHKSNTLIPFVPEPFIKDLGGMRFWPRGIKFYVDNGKSYSFKFDMNGKEKKITTTEKTIVKRWNEEVKPFIELNDDDAYQSMLSSYVDMIMPTLTTNADVKEAVVKTDEEKATIKRNNDKAKETKLASREPDFASNSLQVKAIERRKMKDPSIIIEMIRFRKATQQSFAMVGKKYSAHGASLCIAQNFITGLTMMFESEFPIDGTSWEEYLELIKK